MDRLDRIREAKLMAIEEILVDVKHNDDYDKYLQRSLYEYAERILDAILVVEIKEELREHEASLETRD